MPQRYHLLKTSFQQQFSAADLMCLMRSFCITEHMETVPHRNKQVQCNYNCNWGTCIAPPIRRLRTHHIVNPYPGARRQNETSPRHDEVATRSTDKNTNKNNKHPLLPGEWDCVQWWQHCQTDGKRPRGSDTPAHHHVFQRCRFGTRNHPVCQTPAITTRQHSL